MTEEKEKILMVKYPFIEHLNGEGFRCEDGWFNLIDATFTKLKQKIDELDIDVKIIQTKEKFAGLTIYLNDNHPDLIAITMEAQDLSYKICEKCGAIPGHRHEHTMWGYIRTLCTSCNKNEFNIKE